MPTRIVGPIAAGVLLAFAALTALAYRMRWHRIVWRYKLPVAIVSIPLLGLGIFVGYELGSPLFVNRTVVEELPFAVSSEAPTDTIRDTVESTTGQPMENRQSATDEQVPLPKSEGEVTPSPNVTSEARPTPSREEDAAATDAGAETTPKPTLKDGESSDAGAVAVRLKVGEFQDQDALHKGSGQATIYRGPDGAHLLRLDDLDVTNGPDLFVLLSPHNDPNNPDEVKTEGYVNLGELKGNRGNQNYPIPSDVDVPSQGSVVIYCRAFSVIFSVAPLQDVG